MDTSQLQWGIAEVETSKHELVQRARWDLAARLMLRDERRQQGIRMVTQRMQQEEDLLCQLRLERERSRQAELSLQAALQEIAQLRRHHDHLVPHDAPDAAPHASQLNSYTSTTLIYENTHFCHSRSRVPSFYCPCCTAHWKRWRVAKDQQRLMFAEGQQAVIVIETHCSSQSTFTATIPRWQCPDCFVTWTCDPSTVMPASQETTGKGKGKGEGKGNGKGKGKGKEKGKGKRKGKRERS